MKNVIVILSEGASQGIEDVKKRIEDLGGIVEDVPGVKGRLMVKISPDRFDDLRKMADVQIERSRLQKPYWIGEL